MACIFLEGFDKYGGVQVGASAMISGGQLLLGGEWNNVTNGSTLFITSPLSTTGYAISYGNGTSFSRTLAGNYARLIGGVRFSTPNLVNAAGNVSFPHFSDSGSFQCSIALDSSGHIVFKNGSYNSGTVIATSTVSITSTSVHYLEWDIAFSATGAYQIWLDGVSILSGTGNTKTTANNYANTIGFGSIAGTSVMVVDDLYVFDTTGTRNNAALITAPRIETTFPSSDNSVQFSVGASIIGTCTGKASGSSTHIGAANWFALRPVTPTRNGTINNISWVPITASGASNTRPLVYTDNAGVPGTLMSTGATIVGTAVGVTQTLPLTTPQTLTAGTQYWIGAMSDTTLNPGGMLFADSAGTGRSATVTFTSGAPSTAPATIAAPSFLFWGNYTLAVPNNTYEVALQPPPLPGVGASYVLDSTVGHEDLYNFTPLTTTPAQIYCVATKAYMSKSDTGARTVSVRCKSGATEVASAAVGPPTTFSWTGLYNDADPGTSATWTISGVNNALGGYHIDS